MKNKNIIIIFSSFIIVLFITIISLQGEDKVILENEKSSNKIISSNALTMMYETETGSGEYQVSSDTSWPQEGYIFNEQLSSCEHGSSIAWDDNNKRVIVEANSADKCYVYFDKVSYTIGDQNTMELSVDESGRLIASAVTGGSAGSAVIEVLHLLIVDDITNVNISVRYNPSASLYKGRTTISNYYSKAPLLVDTGVDKYADGEPIIYTGSLRAGDELWLRIVRNNYTPTTDKNIDFIITGEGL